MQANLAIRFQQRKRQGRNRPDKDRIWDEADYRFMRDMKVMTRSLPDEMQ